MDDAPAIQIACWVVYNICVLVRYHSGDLQAQIDFQAFANESFNRVIALKSPISNALSVAEITLWQ